MHSDLFELCDAAREQIAVPAFPSTAIRMAAQTAPARRARKRPLITTITLVLSAVAIAAAAELATQSHIRLTPSGGMVLSSSARMGSHPIHSEAEIRQAAQQLNFSAILPAGLPPGTKPTRLFTAGKDTMAVTYDLPGAWRASHHLLWMFLLNPATIGSQHEKARNAVSIGGRMSQTRFWRIGDEQVILVSNGLTAPEVNAIQRAMQQEAH